MPSTAKTYWAVSECLVQGSTYSAASDPQPELKTGLTHSAGVEAIVMQLPGTSVTQAEEAQGMESAQQEALTQPAAPLAADSNHSQATGTGARGRGRGRGRGRRQESSSRPAVDRTGTAAGERLLWCIL